MQEIPARSGVLAAMVVVVLAFGMAPAPALATPGGVDANGCHTSKKQGHHCHPERAPGRWWCGRHPERPRQTAAA